MFNQFKACNWLTVQFLLLQLFTCIQPSYPHKHIQSTYIETNYIEDL